MKKFLVVVDMQNDFVTGSLGSSDASAIVDNAVRKIESFDGEIIATYDTHFHDYLSTAEGKKLPVEHCIKGTDGWQLAPEIEYALDGRGCTRVEKVTFGSVDLPSVILEKADGDDFTVELIGLCTDICVVSNALLLKANFPEKEIFVDAKCCAGVSPETHNAALETMRCCQINIIE